MLKTRVMPCLLLKDSRLVKTINFKKPNYVGDPINTVRIYNEMEVDELVFLDITATVENKKPPFDIIYQIATECFMPFAYGGGVKDLKDIKKIFNLGVEKVAINSYAVENPSFIKNAANLFGSQSIVVSVDVKKNRLGGYNVYTHSGKKPTKWDPVQFAVYMEEMGAGELLLTSIDRDGTMQGYDNNLIKKVSDAVSVPVIACGGVGKIEHFAEAVKAGASAVAAGSFVVYQGLNRGVLINFPARGELEMVLEW